MFKGPTLPCGTRVAINLWHSNGPTLHLLAGTIACQDSHVRRSQNDPCLGWILAEEKPVTRKDQQKGTKHYQKEPKSPVPTTPQGGFLLRPHFGLPFPGFPCLQSKPNRLTARSEGHGGPLRVVRPAKFGLGAGHEGRRRWACVAKVCTFSEGVGQAAENRRTRIFFFTVLRLDMLDLWTLTFWDMKVFSKAPKSYTLFAGGSTATKFGALH